MIGIGPERRFSDLPLLSSVARTPVIGEALWRITPRFMQRSGLSNAFAKGFDTENGFEDSDQPVDDLRAMTYTAFDRWPDSSEEWDGQLSLGRRLAGANVPALIILGAEDQIVDSDGAAAEFKATVPAARVRILDGVGHSPNVEAPEETAAMLEGFAGEAEVELPEPEPKPEPRKDRAKDKQKKG